MFISALRGYEDTKVFTIRNATFDDATMLSKWWNDGKIMAYVGLPNGSGEMPKSIAERLKADTDDTCRTLIIEINSIAVGEMHYSNEGTTPQV